MRSIYKQILIIIAISVTARFAIAQETVRITNGEWPPYLSKNLKYYGLASHIVTDAFALNGIKVEYGFFPWARAFRLAQKGEWDGTAVWLRSPEREKEFYLSEPVVQSRYVFFHMKATPFDWQSIDDLKKYVIGGTLEYNYGEAFQSAEKNGLINVRRVPKDEINFSRLLAGRIDIFPIDLLVGYTMLYENYDPAVVATVTNHMKALRVDPLHLLLSKKVPNNEKLIQIFNQGLKKLNEAGKIDQYFQESQQGGDKLK